MGFSQSEMSSGERLPLRHPSLRLSVQVSSEGTEEDSKLVPAHLHGRVGTLNVPLSLLNDQHFRLCLHQNWLPEASAIHSKHTSWTNKKLPPQALKTCLLFLADLSTLVAMLAATFPFHTHDRKRNTGLPMPLKAKKEKSMAGRQESKAISHTCRFSLRHWGKNASKAMPFLHLN